MHAKDSNGRKNEQASIEMKMNSRKGYQEPQGKSRREWRSIPHPFCSPSQLILYSSSGIFFLDFSLFNSCYNHPGRTSLYDSAEDRFCRSHTHHNLGPEHDWRWFLPRATVCWGLNSPLLSNESRRTWDPWHQPKGWEKSGLVAARTLCYSSQRWHPLLLTLLWPVRTHGNPNSRQVGNHREACGHWCH